MTSVDRHRKVMALFDEVCDLPDEERDALLSAECTNDPELRREIESMLRHDKPELSFVEAAANKNAEFLADGWTSDSDDLRVPPAQIGAYRIIREIGRGGMGVIYEAQQDSPNRRVALKVLKGDLSGQEMLKRFEHEAHVLGQLQHPGIASIHEAGISDSAQGRRPYFAMELIDGAPLDDFADTHQLSPNTRLELMARVCDAVQYAHQKGVIHRDLKPSNILVMEQDGDTSLHSHRTHSSGNSLNPVGRPKVLDFGIARVTDSDIQTMTVQTEVGQLIGTLGYMSPEQISGSTSNLDTRCDIYALGVVLYQILARKRPYDLRDMSVAAAARIVREDDPPLLGTHDRSLRGDVETIVAKAMEKDRDRRYQSAAEFATDIRRYLTDQPIEARPASTYYQMSKFAKRNRGLVAGMIAALTALSLGLVGTSIGLLRAEEKRREAEQNQERLVEVAAFQSDLLANVDTLDLGRKISEGLQEHLNQRWRDQEFTSLQIESRMSSLQKLLQSVNNADLAMLVLEEGVLEPARIAIEERFAGKPDVALDLHEALGRTAYELGMSNRAEQHWTKALALLKEFDGQPARVVSCMSGLAQTIKSERPTEALSLLLEAREVYKRVSPPDLVMHAQLLTNIGDAHAELGDLDKGQSLFEEALAIASNLPPENTEMTPLILEELGLLSMERGRVDDAERYYLSVLESRLQSHDESDESVFRIRRHLGNLYLKKQDPKAAERHLRPSYDAHRTRFGHDHPRTLGALNSLAGSHLVAGQLEEAYSLYNHSLEMSIATRGSTHPETLTTQKHVGIALFRMGKTSDGIAHFRQVYSGRRELFGDDHPRTLYAALTFGQALMQMGDTKDAIRELEAAHATAQRVLAKNHGVRLSIARALSFAYGSSGRWSDAEQIGRELVKTTRDKSLGIDLTPMGDPIHLTALSDLGHALMKQRKFAEAEPIMRECLEEGRKRDVPRGRYVQHQQLLAVSILRQENPDRYAEAEALLLDSLEELELMDSPPRGAIATCKRRLNQLREFSERHKEAGSHAKTTTD